MIRHCTAKSYRTYETPDGNAHRDGKRFVVRADEKLTAFVELESATCFCYLRDAELKLSKKNQTVSHLHIRFCPEGDF
jgi:hypothetical protein